MFNQFIGVDVSKDTLDLSFQQSGQWKKQQIPNSKSGILQWLDQWKNQSVQVLFEPTGSYSNKLQELLECQQIAYTLVNPRQSRSFAAAIGQINKNDQIDARILAQMGQQLNLRSSKVQSKSMKDRKQLRLSLNALTKQRQQLRNQLHALEQHLEVLPIARQSLEQTLQVVEQQIEQLNQALDQCSDEEELQIKKLMTSVVGIGDKTANLLISLTNGLKDFDDAKKLVKFVGVAPTQFQSGTSIKYKGRISKTGPAQLRATLYMAARSAKKHNPQCKELFERLRANGKPYKVAMVAVMNKLLRQIFAVVKTQTPFDKNYNASKKEG